MPRDAVSRTANVERNGGHKWVKLLIDSLRTLSGNVHELQYENKKKLDTINTRDVSLYFLPKAYILT